MLRFIITREIHDAASGCTEHLFETLDLDVPALQAALFGGGYGPSGYDKRNLVGAEWLPDAATEPQGREGRG